MWTLKTALSLTRYPADMGLSALKDHCATQNKAETYCGLWSIVKVVPPSKSINVIARKQGKHGVVRFMVYYHENMEVHPG